MGNKLDPAQYESVTKQIIPNCGILLLDEVSEALAKGYHLQNKWIVHQNDSGNGKTVLVFGNSTPYHGRRNFFSTFNKTHFKWSSKICYSDIEKINPDIVISVVAERYISGGWRDDK